MSERPEFETIAAGLRFPEGPIAEPDGSVVLVEIARQTLTRVRPDGTTEVLADVPGGPNGAALGPDGTVYLANNGGYFEWAEIGELVVPSSEPPASWSGGALQQVDLATGEVRDLATTAGDTRLRAPNDLVVDAEGGIWFTDHGVHGDLSPTHAGVAYRAPDGTVTPVRFDLHSTNGIGLSPAGDRLYVAETHAGRLWAWDVIGPGQLASSPDSDAPHGGTLLYDAPEGSLFDSLAVDGEGWVCVGTLGLGVGGITAVAPDGSTVEHHLVGDDPLITNICFGGEGLRTAYVTSSGKGELLSFAWPRPGLALHFA